MAINTNLPTLASRRENYKQVVQLLSGGYVDRNAFPDGMVTVYPWDTQIDEWLRARLRKGKKSTVLWEVTDQIADLNGCPVEKMVVGDVYTILLVSRSIRYANEIVYTSHCPYCNDERQEKIAVPNDLVKVGVKPPDYPGWDIITLPKSRDTVKVRPLTVQDEIDIADRDPVIKEKVTDRLARVFWPILEIGGGKVESLDEIVMWYNALSPRDADELEVQENALYPHLDTKLDHTCDQCGRVFSHVLDIDTDFFRPSGGANT